MAISILGMALDACSQAMARHDFFLKGKVLDAKKLTPVPYANVHLQFSRQGTSCNENGEFDIHLDRNHFFDTLVFSAIGYNTYKIAADHLPVSPEATVLLEEATIDLKEVAVTAQSPVDIIRKALLNRAENYGTAPHKLRGVYRIADREDGAYTRLAEAAVDIYDVDYMKKDSRTVDYLAVRHSKDYRTYRWKMDNLNSRTVEALLKPDLIKRPTRATHANGFEKGFFYAFEGYSVLDGKEMLIISATRNPAFTWANYNATFYVRSEDLAIMRVDRDYSIPRPNWAKNEGVKTRVTKDQLILQYKDFGGKLYLNHFVWNLEGDVVSEVSGDKVTKFVRNEELSIGGIYFERPGKIRRAWSDDIYDMKEPYNAILWEMFPATTSGLFTEVTQQLQEKEDLAAQFLSGSNNLSAFNPQKQIDVTALRQDFKVLRTSLEEGHPAMYRYVSRAYMHNLFDSTYNLLSRPMTEIEFYRLIRPLIAGIRCGHTMCKLSTEHQKFMTHREFFFPVHTRLVGDTLLATRGLADSSILAGDRILAVNGKPVSDILPMLMASIEADGYIQTYKNRITEQNFSELYFREFGGSDRFAISVERPANKPVEKMVPAKTLTDMNEQSGTREGNEYRTLKPGVALMKVRSFLDYSERSFKDWVGKSFINISQNKVDHLVIDLRDNSGGRDDYAMYLYSFLANAPFAYHKSLRASTDHYTFLRYTNQDSSLNETMRAIIEKDPSGKFLLRNSHPTLGSHEPQHPNYKGKIYLLINGNTFSAAADFAAIARQHNIGRFFGEETGGTASGNTSNGELILTLPNSRIRVSLPLFMITNAVDNITSGHGVFPDYHVPYTRADILNQTDVVLAFVLRNIP